MWTTLVSPRRLSCHDVSVREPLQRNSVIKRRKSGAVRTRAEQITAGRAKPGRVSARGGGLGKERDKDHADGWRVSLFFKLLWLKKKGMHQPIQRLVHHDR